MIDCWKKSLDILVTLGSLRAASVYRDDQTERLEDHDTDTDAEQDWQMRVYIRDNGRVAAVLVDIVAAGRRGQAAVACVYASRVQIIVRAVTTAALEHGLDRVHDLQGGLVVVLVDLLDGLVQTLVQLGARFALIREEHGDRGHFKHQNDEYEYAVDSQEALVLAH